MRDLAEGQAEKLERQRDKKQGDLAETRDGLAESGSKLDRLDELLREAGMPEAPAPDN
ncbi:MAG: hypothetical protein KDD64_03090 [Bdellovibrionales bacterium]|nr:hypothetical protein [Bdellovibrionales bacterium]